MNMNKHGFSSGAMYERKWCVKLLFHVLHQTGSNPHDDKICYIKLEQDQQTLCQKNKYEMISQDSWELHPTMLAKPLECLVNRSGFIQSVLENFLQEESTKEVNQEGSLTQLTLNSFQLLKRSPTLMTYLLEHSSCESSLFDYQPDLSAFNMNPGRTDLFKKVINNTMIPDCNAFHCFQKNAWLSFFRLISAGALTNLVGEVHQRCPVSLTSLVPLLDAVIHDGRINVLWHPNSPEHEASSCEFEPKEAPLWIFFLLVLLKKISQDITLCDMIWEWFCGLDLMRTSELHTLNLLGLTRCLGGMMSHYWEMIRILLNCFIGLDNLYSQLNTTLREGLHLSHRLFIVDWMKKRPQPLYCRWKNDFVNVQLGIKNAIRELNDMDRNKVNQEHIPPAKMLNKETIGEGKNGFISTLKETQKLLDLVKDRLNNAPFEWNHRVAGKTLLLGFLLDSPSALLTTLTYLAAQCFVPLRDCPELAWIFYDLSREHQLYFLHLSLVRHCQCYDIQMSSSEPSCDSINQRLSHSFTRASSTLDLTAQQLSSRNPSPVKPFPSMQAGVDKKITWATKSKHNSLSFKAYHTASLDKPYSSISECLPRESQTLLCREKKNTPTPLTPNKKSVPRHSFTVSKQVQWKSLQDKNDFGTKSKNSIFQHVSPSSLPKECKGKAFLSNQEYPTLLFTTVVPRENNKKKFSETSFPNTTLRYPTRIQQPVKFHLDNYFTDTQEEPIKKKESFKLYNEAKQEDQNKQPIKQTYCKTPSLGPSFLSLSSHRYKTFPENSFLQKLQKCEEKLHHAMKILQEKNTKVMDTSPILESIPSPHGLNTSRSFILTPRKIQKTPPTKQNCISLERITKAHQSHISRLRQYRQEKKKKLQQQHMKKLTRKNKPPQDQYETRQKAFSFTMNNEIRHTEYSEGPSLRGLDASLLPRMDRSETLGTKRFQAAVPQWNPTLPTSCCKMTGEQSHETSLQRLTIDLGIPQEKSFGKEPNHKNQHPLLGQDSSPPSSEVTLPYATRISDINHFLSNCAINLCVHMPHKLNTVHSREPPVYSLSSIASLPHSLDQVALTRTAECHATLNETIQVSEGQSEPSYNAKLSHDSTSPTPKKEKTVERSISETFVNSNQKTDKVMSPKPTQVSGTNDHDSSCQFYVNNRLCKDVILYANELETQQSEPISGILLSSNVVSPKHTEPSECCTVLHETKKPSIQMCSTVLEACKNDEGKKKTVGPAHMIFSQPGSTTTRCSSNSTSPVKPMPPSIGSLNTEGVRCINATRNEENTSVVGLDPQKKDFGVSYSGQKQADNGQEEARNLLTNQKKIKTKEMVSRDPNEKMNTVEKTIEKMANGSKTLKKKTSMQDASEDFQSKKTSCGTSKKPSLQEEKAEKKPEEEMNCSQKKMKTRRKILWRPRRISEEELQRREMARVKRKENNFREREAYIQRYTEQFSVLKERLESTKRSDLILIEASPRRSTSEENQTETKQDCAVKEKEVNESDNEKTIKDNNPPQETSKSSSTCETTTTCYEDIFTYQEEDDVAFDEYIERNCFL